MAQISCYAIILPDPIAADLTLHAPTPFGLVSTYYHKSYMCTSAKQNESRQRVETMHTIRLCYTGI